jgi:chromosome segregation ATPase
MSDLHSPIEELNEQLQELLNEWTSEISLVLRELADKRSRVAELQSGFDKRGEKIATLEHRLANQQAQFDATKTHSTEEVNRFKEKIAALSREIEDKNRAHEADRGRIESSETEAARLRDEIEALEKRVEAQQRLIEDNESSAKQNAALRDQVARLEHRVTVQQELIDAAESEAKEAASLKAEISTLQTQAAALRRDTAAKQEAADKLEEELSSLRARVAESEQEIATLHSETNVLHTESSDKDRALERIGSELESKQELIQALRREAEAARAELATRRGEVDRLKQELAKAEMITGELRAELQLMLDAERDGAADHSAELQALRAELEARKAVIKSLRADTERYDALEARLEEKRRVNAKLEESLSYHATTIADLKRSAENWRRKYQDLRLEASGEYRMEPTFTETDIRAIENLQKKGGAIPEHTIAIDMRESLAEARRTIGQNSQNKPNQKNTAS